MKKVIFVVIATPFLNGCFQVLALVAPAASGVATGNIYQSAISYSVSYGIKKTTGKTIIENVIDRNKQSNTREKIVKQARDKKLVYSFYPRTYPQTFKSIMLAY